MKIDKTWKLPKPEKTEYGYDWQPVVRVGRVIPFGYKQDENDRDILLPIPTELELLEKAKKYLKQYSYREVSNWLTTNTGRVISHVGLKKRLDNERQRQNKAGSLRRWADYAKKAIAKAEEIEHTRLGATENNNNNTNQEDAA